jgi:hypothetical protein
MAQKRHINYPLKPLVIDAAKAREKPHALTDGGGLYIGFGRDVVELLLAHTERDQSVAAYSHAELVPERKRAMQFLADYIEKLAAGAEVIALRA